MKLNLSFSGLLFLFLLFFSINFIYGQQPLVNLEARDGKIRILDQITSFKEYKYKNTSNKNSPSVVSTLILTIVSSTGTTCSISDGSISAIASGGIAPYKYDRGTGYFQSTGYFINLYASTYTITVTDATGQIASTIVTITNTYDSPTLTISSFQRATTCTGTDASVVLAAKGGVPPYQYSLDLINFQSSNIIANLRPGYYYFWVKDANGCLGSASNFIQGFFYPLSCPTLGMVLSLSAGTCGPNGNIRFRIIPSDPPYNPPYTYSIDGVNYQTGNEFGGLSPGIQLVYFKDGSGVVGIVAVTIYKYCNINLDFITVDAACQQNDGELTVTASNGLGPYTYTIDGINY